MNENTGSIDIPRMREGGQNAIFFASGLMANHGHRRSSRLWNRSMRSMRTSPIFEGHGVCDNGRRCSPGSKERKIAALMGVEGGHMIGNELGLFAILRPRCPLYDAVPHDNDEWADSSTDKPVIMD